MLFLIATEDNETSVDGVVVAVMDGKQPAKTNGAEMKAESERVTGTVAFDQLISNTRHF